MEVSTISGMQHRVADISQERGQSLSPITLVHTPLVSFEESLQPLQEIVPDLDAYTFVVTSWVDDLENIPHHLSRDEVSAIHIYTREWQPREHSLYFLLNTALRTADRNLLKPYSLYLKLLFHALSKLPSFNSETMSLWRGVQDESKTIAMLYKDVKKKRWWWGFSSCTTNMSVATDFLGGSNCTKPRILFNIHFRSHVVDIQEFSEFKREHEVLLLPARYLEVSNFSELAPGLLLVELTEVTNVPQMIKGVDLPVFVGKSVFAQNTGVTASPPSVVGTNPSGVPLSVTESVHQKKIVDPTPPPKVVGTTSPKAMSASLNQIGPVPASPPVPVLPSLVNITMLPEGQNIASVVSKSGTNFETRIKLDILCVQRIEQAGTAFSGKQHGVQRLFHGTPFPNICSIIKSGFTLPSQEGALGKAIYFSPSAKTAVWFCRSRTDTACLLVCDVVVGQSFVAPTYSPHLNKLYLESNGYQSAIITAQGTSTLLDEEVAIYDPSVIQPRYVVDVRISRDDDTGIVERIQQRIGKKMTISLRAIEKARMALTQPDVRKIWMESDEVEDMAVLLELLQSSVCEVDLLLSAFSDVDLKQVGAVAEMIRSNSRVRVVRLTLRTPSTSVRGLQLLALALAHNTSLHELYLYQFELNMEGANAIAAALSCNHTLQVLEFHFDSLKVCEAAKVALSTACQSSGVQFLCSGDFKKRPPCGGNIATHEFIIDGEEIFIKCIK